MRKATGLPDEQRLSTLKSLGKGEIVTDEEMDFVVGILTLAEEGRPNWIACNCKVAETHCIAWFGAEHKYTKQAHVCLPDADFSIIPAATVATVIQAHADPPLLSDFVPTLC